MIEKDTEFYSQLVKAWFSTKLQHDKSLLFLSVFFMWLLVFKTKDAISIIYDIALLSFSISIVSILLIFKVNARYLEEILNGRKSLSKVLSLLDCISFISFVFGFVLSLILLLR